jgi:hypothetical protein
LLLFGRLRLAGDTLFNSGISNSTLKSLRIGPHQRSGSNSRPMKPLFGTGRWLVPKSRDSFYNFNKDIACNKLCAAFP